MTNRDFRLLTARISLTPPMGKKPVATTRIERPRVTLRPIAAKPVR